MENQTARTIVKIKNPNDLRGTTFVNSLKITEKEFTYSLNAKRDLALEMPIDKARAFRMAFESEALNYGISVTLIHLIDGKET
jgi:hypothetical protein